jgi:hypothetical protein
MMATEPKIRTPTKHRQMLKTNKSNRPKQSNIGVRHEFQQPASEPADMTEPDGAAPDVSKSGIVWIASYPKSGNTWVRVFLHNLLKDVLGETAPQDINAMGRFSALEILKANYERVLGFEPTSRHGDEIAAARMKVQQNICESFKGIIFVKAHHALIVSRGTPTINVDVTSGAIYILRNPLDVAISYAHHSGTSIDETIECMNTKDYEAPGDEQTVFESVGSWSQNVESWTRKPHPSIYVMRYEDMLAEPHATFGALARHLLLRPTDEQLARAIERSSFEELQSQEAKSGFSERWSGSTDRFFRDGRAGQWQEVLSRSQVERIHRVHKRQMTRFGYFIG